jgi:hypothetical protein
LAAPWVRDGLWRLARAVPSLDLRFADNKSLVDAVTGASLVTFTRASSGTFVDSAGVLQTAATDVPRFDHNPTTGESLGLLVEEQRTNLLLRSEEFDTGWTGSESNTTITANTNTAPNGTLTADTIDFTNASAFRYQVVSGVAAGTAVTFSVWLASGTKTQTVIRIAGTSTGTGGQLVVSLTPTLTRYSVTVTIPSGNTAVFVGFENRVGVGGGNGSIGTIIPWGAQLEVGAFPTSYIPTTTAAVTRSADVCSITGSAFSSWYRQDEGTVFGDATTPFAVNNVQIADARVLSTDIIQVGYNTESQSVGFIKAGDVNQAVMFSQGVLTGVRRRKVIMGYAVNNFAIATNGLTPITDSSGTTPTNIASIFLGSVGGSGSFLNGTISRFTFWPQRLSNASLQSITQ